MSFYEDDDAALKRAILLSLSEASNASHNSSNSSIAQIVGACTDGNLSNGIRPEQCMPVGLLNSGNKCYLNALLQTYYWLCPSITDILVSRPHLHAHAQSPQLPSSTTQQQQAPNSEFLVQLRRLFTFMRFSRLTFANSIAVAQALELDLEQQDISEFNHVFLDLLMASVCRPVRVELEALFYGTKHQRLVPLHTTEPCTTIDPTTSDSSFRIGPGDFAIDVEPDHQSSSMQHDPITIEQLVQQQQQQRGTSTTTTTIQDTTATVSSTVNSLALALSKLSRSIVPDPPRLQYLQFDLPPVLWIDLKRFRYDHQHNRTHKNNCAFEFEDKLYVDKLLNTPASTAFLQQYRQVEQRVRHLSVEIETHQRLLDASSTVHQFLDTRIVHHASDGHQHELAISKQTLEFYIVPLQQQLEQWKQQRALLLDELHQATQAIQSTPYELYAVLVHEGQPSSGHFYAFLHLPQLESSRMCDGEQANTTCASSSSSSSSSSSLPPSSPSATMQHQGVDDNNRDSGWFLFNDTRVTRVSGWDYVHAHCVGGEPSVTSAYCLVYVDRRRFPHEPASWSELTHESTTDYEPIDLKAEVDQINLTYQHEFERQFGDATPSSNRGRLWL
jgi:hypothetical protein